MRKTWILSEIPSSYRVDFFNLLEKVYGDRLTIAFMPTGRELYKSLIHASPNEPFNKISRYYDHPSPTRRALSLMTDIIRDKPDIIISNGFPLRSLPLVAYSQLTNTELYSWLGETDLSATSRGKARQIFRKTLSRFFDGGVLYSEFSRAYLDSLNDKPFKNLVLGNNTRDSRHYIRNLHTQNLQADRDTIQFITVGFQSPRKNSGTIIRAFHTLRQKTQKAELTIVGDGESLDELKNLHKELGTDGVHFTGKVKPDELIEVYGKSDVLVHSALIDQWPQTHNEAAAAGLAILISNTSGVWDSYMKQYANDVSFGPNDDDRLAELMLKVVDSPEYLMELKQAAQASAFNHDATQCIKDWIDFFEPEYSESIK